MVHHRIPTCERFSLYESAWTSGPHLLHGIPAGIHVLSMACLRVHSFWTVCLRTSYFLHYLWADHQSLLLSVVLWSITCMSCHQGKHFSHNANTLLCKNHISICVIQWNYILVQANLQLQQIWIHLHSIMGHDQNSNLISSNFYV